MYFKPAVPQDIAIIQQIAAATWPFAYAHILSARQVHYMMNMMYHKEVLEEQMSSSDNFFMLLCNQNNIAVGFYQISEITDADKRYKLNKIYLLPSCHGQKLGYTMLQHAEEQAMQKGAKSILLQVNRDNSARRFYSQCGYAVLYQQDFEIGAGFFMNDYVMLKELC